MIYLGDADVDFVNDECVESGGWSRLHHLQKIRISISYVNYSTIVIMLSNILRQR